MKSNSLKFAIGGACLAVASLYFQSAFGQIAIGNPFPRMQGIPLEYALPQNSPISILEDSPVYASPHDQNGLGARMETNILPNKDSTKYSHKKSGTGGFGNAVWTSETNLNAARFGTAPVFVPTCESTTDNGDIYVIGGVSASFAYVAVNRSYNLATDTWTNRAPIPTALAQITPIYLDGKIYVIGGYWSGFSGSDETHIYDVATNAWSLGAPMPIAVGDCGVGVSNGLIYVVGGSYDAVFYNDVQIYNPTTDTWQTGTPKIGIPVAATMGIIDNTIILSGGYSIDQQSAIADSYKGLINPNNPAEIAWEPIDAYPPGASSRMAAGIAAQNDGKVYFAGGDPTGTGEVARSEVNAYNILTDVWELGPPLINAVSNIHGLTSYISGDSVYIVTMGGFDASEIATADYHQRLAIGATIPGSDAILATITAVSETAACDGELSVEVGGGSAPYSYLWNDPTAQTSATASGLCPGEYAVTITDAQGCTATAMGTVDMIVGLGENSTDQFLIFPNPSLGVISIQGDLPTGQFHMRVYNLTGKLMDEFSGHTASGNGNQSFDLSGLTSGMYLIELRSDDFRSTQKWVKY